MRPITKLAIAAAIAALPATAHALDKPPSHPGGGSSSSSGGAPTPIPEPGVIGLFAAGIGGLYLGRRWSKKRRDD